MESTIGILKSKYDAEIHDLKIEVESLNIAWKTTLSNKEEMFKTMTEDYENMKNLLESKLTNSLQENTILTTQNTSLTRSLEEATHEVSNLQSLLQSAKINAEQMEQDRSQLYQKLVNLEGEIRHELDAKFKITLNASHDEWRAKLDRAVEDMRQEKHREHVDLTTILVSKMKLETSNEIDRITDDFIEKFGVLNADKLAAEQNLAVLNQSFNELMSKLSKLRDDHNEDIKKVKLNEQNLAATAKEAMEVNFNTQITQIKVQGAISLNNLEKKHAKNIEEIEQKHLLDLKEQADLNVKNIKEQETVYFAYIDLGDST